MEETRFIRQHHEQKADHIYDLVNVCIGQGNVSIDGEDFSLKVDVPLDVYSEGKIVFVADTLIYDAQTVYTLMAMLHNHFGFEQTSLSLKLIDGNSMYTLTIYARAGE